ncbi:MAG: selenium-binding protein SBP56-related protein [Methylophilaceae bacterium]
MILKQKNTTFTKALIIAIALIGVSIGSVSAYADETSCSPFTPLLKGQEDFVYVWTLGMKGVGDESDKLVTVDVNPTSKKYGTVIAKVSVGGRGEAHHMGFTDDRKFMWAGALDSNKIFIFDVATDPSKPKLVKTINNFVAKSGLVGPHTFYAIPGRMIVTGLSNAKDHGGVTGMVTYNNAGEYINTTPMPTKNGGDGFGYDAAINPNKNAMLTTAFTGWNNYMMDLGKLIKDPQAMKQFGNTTVMWNYKSMKPIKVFNTPGAALEARWSFKPGDNWAVTTTALTSNIYVYKQDDKGEWQQHNVGTIGDPSKIPLPVDIALNADGKSMWVNTFMDGTTRLWDMTDPLHPKETYTKKIGNQVNMVSPSFDGKRVYYTTSLVSNWDMKDKANEQFLKSYLWDGKALKLAFEIDFIKEKLGRAHHMKFQARDLKTLQPLQASTDAKVNLVSN